MSLVRAVRLKLERNPDLRLRIGREISPQHADDRVRFTAQRKRLPNHFRIPAKPPLPQAVAQHHHVPAVRRILLLRESAAQHHRRAKHAEVALRYVNSVDQLRPVSRDVEPRSRKIVRRHVLEDRSLPLPLLELRNRRARPAPLRSRQEDLHNPIRIRIPKRLQQHRIHDRENRRVRPDPQSQRRNRGNRESRALDKQVQRMFHVIPEIRHCWPLRFGAARDRFAGGSATHSRRATIVIR